MNYTKLETGETVFDAAAAECRQRETGGLDIQLPDGTLEDVHLVPAFPLSDSNRMIQVLSNEGEELGFIDDAGKLDGESRAVITEELERSYFMPQITDIIEAEEKLSVLTLETETDRGARTVQIRNPRKSIRKLPHNRVVIRDVDGNRYEISDWTDIPLYGRDFLAQYL